MDFLLFLSPRGILSSFASFVYAVMCYLKLILLLFLCHLIDFVLCNYCIFSLMQHFMSCWKESWLNAFNPMNAASLALNYYWSLLFWKETPFFHSFPPFLLVFLSAVKIRRKLVIVGNRICRIRPCMSFNLRGLKQVWAHQPKDSTWQF